MKKFSPLFILFLSLFFTSVGQQFQWVTPGKGTVYHPEIAVDHAGNSYMVGYYNCQCVFTTAITGDCGYYGAEDGFIAKFNAYGEEQWLLKIGQDNGDVFLTDVTVSPSQNFIYIIGYRDDDLTIGDTLLQGNGAFWCKLDASGVVVQVKNIGSNIFPVNVACGDSSAIFIGGQADDNVPTAFGCDSGITGCFLARFDTLGNCNWVESLPSIYLKDITVDHFNNVSLTGYLSDTTTLGGFPTPSFGSDDIVVARCDASGSWQWVKHYGGTGGDGGYSICMDGDSSILIAGTYKLESDFECTVMTSLEDYDIFLLKLDAAGNCIWERSAGGPGNQYAYSIASDNYHNTYVTGVILDTCTFGDFVLPMGIRFYVAAYDQQGTCFWATETSDDFTASDEGKSIATDQLGNIYTCGIFWGDGLHHFGNIEVTATEFNVFLTKISPLAVGISQFKAPDNFSIYPMPVTGYSVLEADKIVSGHNNYFIFFDILGVQRGSIPFSGNKTIFNKGDLTSGVYFYRFHSDGNIISSGKFIVE